MKLKSETKKQNETIEKVRDERPQNSNAKLFSCSKCKKDLYLTSIEILKHRKMCQSTAE